MTNEEYRERALKTLLSVAETVANPEARISAAQALLWAIREEEAAPAAPAPDEPKPDASLSEAFAEAQRIYEQQKLGAAALQAALKDFEAKTGCMVTGYTRKAW